MLALSNMSSLATEDTRPSVEEVFVTGSRIINKDDIDILPITVFTGEELEQRGYATLEHFVRELPSNRSTLDPYLNPTGAASFDLRGLGIESTLVLMNGRRLAPFGLTDKGVDVSVIPVSVIDRIEILKDGASALYGADAIAGVINIILKKDFYGSELSAQYSRNQNASAEDGSIALSYGTYINDDLALSGYLHTGHTSEYNRTEGIYNQLADQRPNGLNNTGFGGDHAWAILLNEFRIASSPGCPTEPGQGWIQASVFFLSPSDVVCAKERLGPQTLRPQVDSVSTLWQFDYSVGINTSWNTEISYSQRQSDYSFNNRLTCCDRDLGPLVGGLYMPAWHPDNPFAQDLEVLWRVVGRGVYWSETENATSRLVSGFNGYSGKAEWDVSLLAAQTDVKRIFGNRLVKSALQAAMFGLGGSTGDQFLNPFSRENSDDVLDSIYANAEVESKYTELSVEGFYSTPLLELDERSIDGVIGFHLREQEVREKTDDAFKNNDILSLPGFESTNRSRQISSLFVETVVPLGSRADLQLALRYEHYSDFGSKSSPKLAARWQLTNDVLLRASYTESFKAPNFDQLYRPEQESFTIVTDPIRCSNSDDDPDCSRPATEIFTGNPDLAPNTGVSWVFGLVYAPSWASGLALDIDLWQFEVEDIVFEPWADFVLDNLADSDLVVRAPASAEDEANGLPGPIEAVFIRPLNLREQKTRGLDLSLVYQITTRKSGEFTLKWDSSYLDNFETELLSQNIENLAGTQGFPRWRSNMSVLWRKSDWSSSVQFDYVSSEEIGGQFENGFEGPIPFKTDPLLSTAINIAYDFGFDSRINLGCRNCFKVTPQKNNEGFYRLNYGEVLGQVWYLNVSYRF